MTLGFCIISRNCEIDILKKCLDSVKDHVDNIYITVADKEPPTPEMEALAKEYKANLSYFEWCNDFSAARNFNFSQCKDEWAVWADTDDTVRGMELAKPMLERALPHIGHVLCPYEYSYFPNGKPDNVHPKERFIRMGVGYHWKGYLHETCIRKDEAFGLNFEDIVWEHHTTPVRNKQSAERNIAIIESEIKKQSETGKIDPRTVFNLGMALASVAQLTQSTTDWERSIRAFYRYLDMSGWDLHAYMAWRFIGTGLGQMGRPELALNAYFECLKLEPSYKDVYALLGQTYLVLNDKDKAKAWFQLALLAGKENAYATDRSTSLVMPLLSLAELAARDGKLKDAESYIKFAIKYTGTDNEAVHGMYQEIKKMKKDLKQGEKIAATLKTKEDYDNLDAKWKAHPKIIEWRKAHVFKDKTSGNEIVIYCGQSWEEWNPDMEKSGIGGSEEAVINLSRELKALGWNVSVYGSHGDQPKEYDGVMYWPYWAYNPNEPTDIFIGWRNPNIFDVKINAKKKYLWLHDVVAVSSLTEARINAFDKLMVLSKFHRDLYPQVPDEKIFLTGNGINPKHFEIKGVERKPYKIMYASAPNRGLMTLLELWPEIKKQVPEAELYWAYGWETFDLGMKHNPQARKYKEQVIELLKQDGVHDLGRIGHEELAKHMLETSVWAYPTFFDEIFCITAVKMQAAGAIPVHSGKAAIGEKEICPFGVNIEAKKIHEDKEEQTKFVEAIVNTLKNPPPREPMMDWAKQTWAWSQTARGWDKEFR